jgi:hypothetical protein
MRAFLGSLYYSPEKIRRKTQKKERLLQIM